MNNKYKNYIEDCLEELIERNDEAQSSQHKGEFQAGQAFAYTEILSYLFNQAEIFQIKADLKDEIKNFHPPI